MQFIWRDQETMLRYFKPKSLDLIVSNLGIFQLYREEADSVRLKGMQIYLRKLCDKLALGGLLVVDVPQHLARRIQEKLRDELSESFSTDTYVGGAGWIIRVKRNIE